MGTETNGKVQMDVRDGGKRKREWGSRIYNFFATGGMILLLVGGLIPIIIIIRIIVS